MRERLEYSETETRRGLNQKNKAEDSGWYSARRNRSYYRSKIQGKNQKRNLFIRVKKHKRM